MSENIQEGKVRKNINLKYQNLNRPAPPPPMKLTKKVPCSYKGCCQRRPHYMLQDEEREIQMVEVSHDYEGDAYCSLTCAMLDGKISAKEK